MRYLTVSALAFAALAASASAFNLLTNEGFETNTNAPLQGPPDNWGHSAAGPRGVSGTAAGFGQGGAWAQHASFSAPGNAGLGNNFAYYTPAANESFGQWLGGYRLGTSRISYRAFAVGTGSHRGFAMQFGYLNVDGNKNSLVLIPETRQQFTTTGTWTEFVGQAWAPSSGFAGIGKELVLMFVPVTGDPGTGGGIWVDNVAAVPEPGTILAVLTGMGAMALRRRFKK